MVVHAAQSAKVEKGSEGRESQALLSPFQLSHKPGREANPDCAALSVIKRLGSLTRKISEDLQFRK